MKDNGTTGDFSKVRKLITVLKKSNGKAVIGDGALISPVAARILIYGGLLVLTGLLLFGAYYVQPYLAGFIPAKGLAQGLMLILFIMNFVLAIKNVVAVLYTADDLELLLPMPFSADQIAAAKLVAASAFPVIITFMVLNSVCLGFGIRAGEGPSFIIGILLSGVLIPVTGIALATLLVVITFRVFGFIRNRDINVALGGIFTLGLTIAYIIISNSINRNGSGEAAAETFNAFASISAAFPNISFMSRFMFEGSIPGLLISLAVCAAVILLAILAVRAFYISTALTMQSTGTGGKAVSEEMLHSRKKDVLRALTAYEWKSTRRNPSYLIYGFVMTMIWPALFLISFVFRKGAMPGAVSPHFGTVAALFAFVSFGVTASCFACGFNVLPGTAFSREGSSFAAIRALPVDLKDFFRCKRNFSLLVCSMGSVLYVVILGIICVAAGFISLGSSWTVLVGAWVSFMFDLILIDLMLLRNSQKPVFNWDSETELSRKLGVINMIAIVLGVLMIAVFVAALAVGATVNDPGIMKTILIISVTAAILISVLALGINRLVPEAVSKNLMKAPL